MFKLAEVKAKSLGVLNYEAGRRLSYDGFKYGHVDEALYAILKQLHTISYMCS